MNKLECRTNANTIYNYNYAILNWVQASRRVFAMESCIKIIIVVLLVLELAAIVLWPVNDSARFVTHFGCVGWIELGSELLEFIQIVLCY